MERIGEVAEWAAQGLLVAELNGYLFHLAGLHIFQCLGLSYQDEGSALWFPLS